MTQGQTCLAVTSMKVISSREFANARFVVVFQQLGFSSGNFVKCHLHFNRIDTDFLIDNAVCQLVCILLTKEGLVRTSGE